MPAITKDTHPALHAAFHEIVRTNCGDLLAVAYPEEAVDMERFEVPNAWAHFVAPAEAGLARLRSANEADWREFLIGGRSGAMATAQRENDLEPAEVLLEGYRSGWPTEIGLGRPFLRPRPE